MSQKEATLAVRTHGQRQRQGCAVCGAATPAPIGLTEEGLLVGLRIIGPEGEDLTTIEFARLLAAEIGGFVPPPVYA